MPFPVYLRRLRFREVKPEITLLEKKQHWGRSWKAFLEITTLFDFASHFEVFRGGTAARENDFCCKGQAPVYASGGHGCQPSVLPAVCSQRWLLRENTGRSAFQKVA